MGVVTQFNGSTGKVSFTASNDKVQTAFDFVPGNDCTTCWGPSKAYGPLPSPIELELIIEGVLKGDLWIAADGEPMNGTFTITQSSTPALACFYGKAPSPTLSIPLLDTLALVTAKNVEDSTYFIRSVFPACWTSLTNLNQDQATEKFYSGTMTLVFP